MEWAPIAKPVGSLGREPNLADYDEARAGFTWAQARAQLDGLPGGGLNIAHEALFRHLRGPVADRVALRFLARDKPITGSRTALKPASPWNSRITSGVESSDALSTTSIS